MTLSDAYRLALEHDATLAAARQRALADQEVSDQSLARLLPRVQIEGTYDTREYERVSYFGLQNRFWDSNYLALSLIQPVYQREYWYRWLQSSDRVALADVSLALERQQLALDVAEAYFNILLAERNLDLSEAESTSYEQQWKKIAKSLESGFASKTDLLDARARFDDAQARRHEALADLKVKRQKLQVHIGPMASEVRLTNLTLKTYDPKPLEHQDWNALAQQDNLEVRKAQLELAVSDGELEAARSGHYPQVNLEASVSNRYSQDPSITQGEETRVGLSLSVPVFQGGGIDSRVREAAYRLESSQQRLRDVKEQVQLKVSTSLESIATAQATIAALKSSVRSWEAFVDAAERSYEVGLKDYSSVLDARARVFGSLRDLARRVHDELFTRLTLSALTGRLDDASLAAIDALLYGTKSGS